MATFCRMEFRSTMLTKHKFKFLICIIWLITSTMFCAKKSGELQLVTMLLLPVIFGVLIASIISVFRNWSKDKFLSFIPLVACILSVILPLRAGTEIRNQLFEYRLPQYQRMISRIESESVEVGHELSNIQIKPTEEYLALNVYAIKEGESLYVEFLTGGGFPVKHSGYLYSQSGVIPVNSMIGKRWPSHRKINEYWFRFSD